MEINCPCEECLVFPICKTKNLIKCELLFDYLRLDNNCRWNDEGLKKVKELYGRSVHFSSRDQKQISFQTFALGGIYRGKVSM